MMNKHFTKLQFHGKEIFTRWLSSMFAVSRVQLMKVSSCDCLIIAHERLLQFYTYLIDLE